MSTRTTSPASRDRATGGLRSRVLRARRASGRLSPWAWVVIVAAVIFVLALLQLVTGVEALASAGTLRATLIATVPIALAGLGGLWSERAGVVNIGLEGMMILGTYGAGFFGYHYGAWAGVAGAVLMGAIGGLIHAVATVGFGVDHIISGVAINIIALGAVQYLAGLTFTGLPGGGSTQSPKLPDVGSLTIGPVSDGLRGVEERDLFFVSQVAAALRAVTTNVSFLVLLALLLFVGSYVVLWRTTFGLRLRSCGESPSTAESLGVAVLRYKFTAVLISGGLAGLAGGFLALVAASNYRDGQTGGRGYIGLAAMIFGNWRPGGVLAGSGLFGYTETLGLRGGGDSVHALLLAVAVLAVGVAVWQLRAKRIGAGVFAVAGALAAGLVYLSIDSVPGDFSQMTPYVITLLVLAFASQRLRMPAADGQVYRKGSVG
ncbi:ABC transporter permease [Nocardioides sp. SYSU DS0663]|uniref:ABC transporter permease n=1 Tax=Nocardioides sp. SYSU DS0663 TaxID=3416445 RepID=UPI003F4B007E